MHTLFATLQLSDSFFPTGMFTQSHGLESFVAAGTAGEARIEPLLHGYLLHIAALGDALAARWVTPLPSGYCCGRARFLRKRPPPARRATGAISAASRQESS